MHIELKQLFEEEIMKLSIHPSGFSFLAASKSKIYLIDILLNRLSIKKEINFNNTQILEFSNEGRFFAISNNYKIQIIDYFKNFDDPKIIFEGHKTKDNKFSQVNNLIWSPDDICIYSSDTSGKILKWELEKFTSPKDYSIFDMTIQNFDLTFNYSKTQNHLGKEIKYKWVILKTRKLLFHV